MKWSRTLVPQLVKEAARPTTAGLLHPHTSPSHPQIVALQAGGAVGGVGQYAYDQAVGLKNSAGQTWDEAMDAAYK